MHDDVVMVEGRLRRFVADRIEPAVVRRRVPLTVAAWTAPGEPVPFGVAAAQRFEPVAVPWRWGTPWSTTWLRVTGAVPSGWRSDAGTRLEVHIDLGFDGVQPGFQAEGLAFRLDGSAVKAIQPRNSWAPWTGDGDVELLVEAAANPDVTGGWHFRPTPLGDPATAGSDLHYELRQVDLVQLDTVVWELLQDIRALTGLMAELPEAGSRRPEILRALERMLDVLDPGDVAATAVAGRAALRQVLDRPANASAHRVVATGHAHIDSAWLWPARETKRKVARTVSNVLALMDEHPEMVFACSSAQQFAWLKESHPELFERVRERVAEGRFVPVGGMWVESDTNMPGSEALARQFVMGKRFFIDEFGVECEEAWLPDSFGYSAALPQIVRAAGERWFLTQKISWNQVNRMPHHTFRWEGIDGTRVFTHFPPADTYNSDLSAADLARSERQFADKGRATVALLPFGFGDGGGGPTREMLAAASRTASLEGSPTVRIGSPASFFADAEAEYPDAPVWVGEMYLELHRGVYTTQARTKQGNRRNERLLHEAELWATTAAVRVGAPYPKEELDRCWRTVLLLQFHDILPGSGIAWVHREAEQRHAEVSAVLEALIADSLSALAGSGDRELVANAAPHQQQDVPALGVGRAPDRLQPVEMTESVDGWTLRNGTLVVQVDRSGRITSLRSGEDGREVVPPGSTVGTLQLHHDLPNLWDAWDLDAHYRRSTRDLIDVEDVRAERMGDGAVQVVSARTTPASRIVERVVLRPGAQELAIELDIDWHEDDKILKLEIPLDLRADHVDAETQFGHVRRPTHTNTSWDAARFEQCQHRWAHVAEPGFGVTVLNDSTYGYDVGRETRPDGGTTTTLRLSVLRAPSFPDPVADRGHHEFRFGIAPATDLSDAVRLGHRRGVTARRIRGDRDVVPLVTSSAASVVIETVKLAEDGSGDVVVRLYESLGGRATTAVRLDVPAEWVRPTDLLERTTGAPAQPGSELTITLRPFELVTLRFGGVSSVGRA